MRKSGALLLFVLFGLIPALAQSDRGAITGTVTDQGGGIVPGVSVVATNLATNQELRTVTTETGHYTIPAIPAGAYSLTVEQPGFRKFVQTGITVQVALTARLDVVLEVGAADNLVTVSADAPLLRTESAEQSTVLSGDKVNQLPLNFANNGVRNPLVFLQLAPGTSVGAWNDIRVNGSPRGTFRVIFEGQDATSALNPRLFNESQPSIDGVEEFTLQSTNFSAEFGQVGGGLVNFSARSGSNGFHGTVYEYINNEALNAAPAFAPIGPDGEKTKTRIRQHDFGGTFGGPVKIPKLYDGSNRTFFFFNLEVYHQREARFGGFGNLPNAAYRNGDFSNLLTGRVLAQDPLGRDILEGSLFDPTTGRVVNGRVVRDPFPNNIIPTSRFDPIAANIQSMMPPPDPQYADRLNNNFERRFQYRRIEQIPTWKVDHSFSTNSKIAFYFGMQRTRKDNGQDGLPDPISQRRDQPITSKTIRVNHDYFFTPTMINHFGIGYQRYYNPDTTPITDYDSASELGLRGAVVGGFPRITFNAPVASDNLGPTNYQLYTQDKPTIVETLSWVRKNHTFKFGGEYRIDTFNNLANNGATGTYNFAPAQTGQPSTEGQNLGGGTIGHSYASFLLGLTNNASINNPTSVGFRRSSWAAFVHDSWKVTPKLTLELGLRYDVQNALHELHYRTSMFAPDIPNPAAGNLPGATLFAGEGPGRCNCDLTKTYPWAVGPRFGFAYAFNPKTVIRGGWGITYGALGGFNYIGAGNSLGFGFNTIPFSNPAFGESAFRFRDGLVYNPADLYAQNINAGIRPTPGQLNNPPAHIDRNGGRPPRINNWVLNIQRELSRDLVLEMAYVANRGVWYEAVGLVDLNALPPERIATRGLNILNADDRAVLTSRLDSPLAQARGFTPPYSGFPLSSTVAQSLRPFPQFGSVGIDLSPLGNTWYDSLQVKATKRFSHGVDFILSYTWSKNLATVSEQGGATVPVNNLFDSRSFKTLSPNDQPQIFVSAFRYEVPGFGLARTNSFTRALLEGWNVSGIFRYSSGEPIQVPTAQNNLGSLLFRSTFANRVAGQPLFLKDLNCGCIDPNQDFVLNPAAWADPAPGTFGSTNVYQSDYRTSRLTSEDMSFGKVTRFGESYSLEIRLEFFNVFNRVSLNNPESGNALATQRRNAAGVPQGGFGRVDGSNTRSLPRSGQIALRFRF
jgi:Carboxypeptidase regulatory-like domain/TonB dependent receptor-like, beta-barrel